jgi:two-component system OmpR family response regulator
MRRLRLKRILVVDDDPDIQMVTSIALGSFGRFTVKACGSAREALALAPRFKPDLILLDVVMPGMDWARALRALRGLPTVAKVPVVFITARVQPKEIRAYKKMGSVDVIAKPFEAVTLAARIRTIWNRHHA